MIFILNKLYLFCHQTDATQVVNQNENLLSLLGFRSTYSILQMNLDCKIVFRRKTVLESKIICKQLYRSIEE
jgi:hypothetical protein